MYAFSHHLRNDAGVVHDACFHACTLQNVYDFHSYTYPLQHQSLLLVTEPQLHAEAFRAQILFFPLGSECSGCSQKKTFAVFGVTGLGLHHGRTKALGVSPQLAQNKTKKKNDDDTRPH